MNNAGVRSNYTETEAREWRVGWYRRRWHPWLSPIQQHPGRAWPWVFGDGQYLGRKIRIRAPPKRRITLGLGVPYLRALRREWDGVLIVKGVLSLEDGPARRRLHLGPKPLRSAGLSRASRDRPTAKGPQGGRA